MRSLGVVGAYTRGSARGLVAQGDSESTDWLRANVMDSGGCGRRARLKVESAARSGRLSVGGTFPWTAKATAQAQRGEARREVGSKACVDLGGRDDSSVRAW